MMRQAGRYLPEYLAIRDKHSFLDVCHLPELACEVTLQPIRRFHFDAAILFSDILVPLVPMGADLSFGKGHGPQIANRIQTADDVAKVRKIDPLEQLPTVLTAVTMLRQELPVDVALIGFAGAPFTLATYWIEGGKPEPFAQLRRFMLASPTLFQQLLLKFADMVADYLIAQYQAGANAVQLFDTWAGILTENEYRTVVLPSVQLIFNRLNELNIPSTYYIRGSHHLISAMGETGATVISLDWRTPISSAIPQLRANQVIQGNLDPTLLLADKPVIRQETRRILSQAVGHPHIFNLGHGILPSTPIWAVETMLDEIRGTGV